MSFLSHLAQFGVGRAGSIVLPIPVAPRSLLFPHSIHSTRRGSRVDCTTSNMETQGGGKAQHKGDDNRTPPPGNLQSQSVLQREIRTAVDNLNWPPLASRGWVPLQAPAATVSWSEEGGAAHGSYCGGGGHDEPGGGEGSGERCDKLKFLSWNVLCDGLSGAHPTRGGFLKAPEGCLDWEKRRWKLLQEIIKWNCDVMVLQEVDHHHDWLSPMLAKEGYRSLFVKKPLAPGLAFNPHLEDGCSLFYRATTPTAAPAGGGGGDGTSAALAVGGEEPGARKVVGTTTETAATTTLDLLDAHTFTLAVVEEEDGAEGAGAPPAERVAGNQVAIISLLGVCSAEGVVGGGSGGREQTLVIVTTTHLKAAKDAQGEMIRARQAKQLLDEVTRFRAGHEQARGLPASSIPLVVAGDFNATPRASGGYEPLCFRQITAHDLALRSALPITDDFFTTWKVRPAKQRPPQSAGAGAGTGVVEEVGAAEEIKHCIDYVWVSGGLQPTRRSTLPSAEELGPARAPSFVYPSDHFAMAVELRLPSPRRAA